MAEVGEDFLEFIKPLSVMALAQLAKELRENPEDKEFLYIVLKEIGTRDLTDPNIVWNRVNG